MPVGRHGPPDHSPLIRVNVRFPGGQGWHMAATSRGHALVAQFQPAQGAVVEQIRPGWPCATAFALHGQPPVFRVTAFSHGARYGVVLPFASALCALETITDSAVRWPFASV